jgi:hypothetical protein
MPFQEDRQSAALDALPSLADAGFFERRSIEQTVSAFRATTGDAHADRALSLCRMVLAASPTDLRRNLAAEVYALLLPTVREDFAFRELAGRGFAEVAAENSNTRRELAERLVAELPALDACWEPMAVLMLGEVLGRGPNPAPLVSRAASLLEGAATVDYASELRYQAVHALGKIACGQDACDGALRERIAGTLIKLLDDGDVFVRRGAACYLGRMLRGMTAEGLQRRITKALARYAGQAEEDGTIDGPLWNRLNQSFTANEKLTA